MKRFVRHIILFLPLALLFSVLMLWLLGGTGRLRNVSYRLGGDDFLYSKSREIASIQQVDVLFLGSSHAYRTFDPRIFAERGISVFNLGSSNQTPLQSEVLLRQYLDSCNPRLVVIEVHPDIIDYDGIESALSLLSNVPPSWHMLPMALRSRNLRVLCTAPYAMLHNLFPPSFRSFDEPPVRGVNHYVSGGYVERDMARYTPSDEPPYHIAPLPAQTAALRRCLNYLDSKAVPFLLVQTPDTRTRLEAYSNLSDFQSLMSSLGPFCALRSDALVDTLHFFDSDHLNQRGVDLYCSQFRDSIIIPLLNTL